MRRVAMHIALTVLMLAGTPVARATSPPSNMGYDCAGVSPEVAHVRAKLTRAEAVAFADRLQRDSMLEAVLEDILGKCGKAGSLKRVYLRGVSDDWGKFDAVYDFAGGRWRIDGDSISKQVREASAETAEQERRANVADAFKSKNGIADWIVADQLLANPFAFEGKTVGTIADFAEMLDRNRALFSGLVVDGVDPAMFHRRGENAVLAVEITGREAVLTSAGEVSLPTARLIAALNCSQADCTPFR